MQKVKTQSENQNSHLTRIFHSRAEGGCREKAKFEVPNTTTLGTLFLIFDI